MKKILVPSDFSQNSKHALQFAADLALQSGATLEIMHANTAAAYVPMMPEYYTAQYVEVENYAESVADDLKNLKREFLSADKYEKLQLETCVHEGFLHSAINAVVDEDGCDFVVMGTKGATGATEFFVGSNTEKVIRTAKCPVLVVPANDKDFTLKTVVLPSTLRPDQAVGFAELAQWQRYFDFDVKVLYLNNPGGYDSMDKIEEAAQGMAKAAGLKNIEVFGTSNVFSEDKAILQFADANKADMIVMVTHQRQGLSHMMFGSLTEDTANHSTVPVLCVPVSK